LSVVGEGNKRKEEGEKGRVDDLNRKEGGK